KERAVQVRDLLAVPVHVVRHDVDVVHISAKRSQVVVLVVFLRRGNCRSEQQSWTNGVELAPELGGHHVQILGVFWAPGNQAAVNRIFPVDVNSIEDPGRVNSGGEVAVDIHVNTGTHKG